LKGNSKAKSSLLYVFQVAFSGSLTLILMSVASRYLAPADLGMFVLAQLYSGIVVGIMNFGLLTGYERNFFALEGSREKVLKLTSSAVLFVANNLIILMVLVYFFQPQVADLIFHGEIVPENLFFIVIIGASASSLSHYYLTFMKNSNLSTSYVVHMISYSLLYFSMSMILMIHLELGIMSLAYAWLSSGLFLLLSLYFSIGKKSGLAVDITLLKEMLKISLPLTPRVFFGVLNTQFDKILLGMIGSASLVGVYHMGQIFSMTIFQFMTALGKVFQPELYRKLFANAHLDRPDEINQYLLPFFYISIFVALVVALFSQDFVSLFLDDEYQEATPIIIILSVYYASMFFGKVVGAKLIYAKKTYLTTVLMFIGIIINVGLNIPLIINWGIIGAAWATTISGVIMTFVGYFVARKYVRIDWDWKKVFIIFSIFLLAVTLSIVDYEMISSFYVLKLLVVFIYIVIGARLSILSFKKNKDTL